MTCTSRKLYGVCEYYTYRTTALLPGIFLFLVWGAILAISGELQPKKLSSKYVPDALVWHTSSGFCLRILGVARIARPHTQTTEHMHFVTRLGACDEVC